MTTYVNKTLFLFFSDLISEEITGLRRRVSETCEMGWKLPPEWKYISNPYNKVNSSGVIDTPGGDVKQESGSNKFNRTPERILE